MVMLVTASMAKAGNVKAAQTNRAVVYSKGSYGNMLRYNGVEVLTTFVVHSQNGVEYPAYCLDANMPGVGEVGNYYVDTTNLITDVNIWKIVKNGYPYKTPSELGCSNEREAFAATKQAVYCQIYGRTANDYEAIGISGERVKNAMAKILSAAQNTTQYNSEVQLYSNQSKFAVDHIDSRYMSQTFHVRADYNIADLSINLEGNYPDGTKIVDNNNKEITQFKGITTFKVIYPIQNAREEGSFRVNAKASLHSYPMIYGKSIDPAKQDYILTGSTLGDSEASMLLSYKENATKLIVKKQETGSKLPLEGVLFRVLDSNKEPIYSELYTNEEGTITITNLLPGKYYLEELKTQEGYVRYDKQIPFEITLDQTFTITVNNTKAEKTEYNNSTGQMNVTQSESQIIISDHQEEINKNEHTTSTDIHVSNKNETSNEQNNHTNIDISNQNINSNKQNTNTSSNIHNENVNTNEQNENVNTNIHNENINTNEQNTNANTNIHNENINTNEQNTNVNTSTSNVNVNTNTQNNKTDTSITNSNTNTNIQNLNGVVKLPKTGM